MQRQIPDVEALIEYTWLEHPEELEVRETTMFTSTLDLVLRRCAMNYYYCPGAGGFVSEESPPRSTTEHLGS